jgi:choline-sulfatase
MSGPGIPAGAVSAEIASQVDLFPTIAETVGAELDAADGDLPGRSLWPALQGAERDRIGFAEYHATGSKSGVFMLRQGRHKLVHYVGMPAQLFDLEDDPDEARDLIEVETGLAEDLEGELRKICDPAAVDAAAKAAQRAKAEFWGGRAAIAREGSLVFTPPPGHAAEIER